MFENERPSPERLAEDIETNIAEAVGLRNYPDKSQKYLDKLSEEAGLLQPNPQVDAKGKMVDTNQEYRQAVESQLQSIQLKDGSLPKFAISESGVIYSVGLYANTVPIRGLEKPDIEKPEIVQVIAGANKAQVSEIDGLRWPFDTFK